MTSPDQKLSLLLTGGYNERGFQELVAPTVAQGSAPVLVESLNTRHSIVPGTCVRSPAFHPIFDGTLPAPFNVPGQDCHGVIPCTTGKSTAIIFRDGVGGAFSLGDAGNTGFNGPLLSVSQQTHMQNCYLPGRISDAGAIPGASATYPISASYNKVSGLFLFAYTATNKTLPTSLDLFVAAYRDDGVIAALPTRVMTIVAAAYGWVGLTSHGANGDRLYCGNAGNIEIRSIIITGNMLIAGVPTALLVNQGAPDVVAVDDNTAAVLSPRPGTPDDATLTRVDVTTNTPSGTVNFTNYLKVGGFLAVAAETIAGISYIAVCCSSPTLATTNVDVLVAATLATARPTAVIAKWGQVGVRFGYTPVNGARVMFALVESSGGATFSVAGSTFGTGVYSTPVTGGTAVVQAGFVPWSMLANRGGALRPSATELYPVFCLVRAYTPTTSGSDPLSPDYCDDPSIDAWMVGSDTEFTPIARVGVVRGATLAPARTAYEADLPSAGLVEFKAGKMLIAYRKDNFQAAASASGSYVGRYAIVDMTAHQPYIAHDKDGVALIAAALPAQWDGAEIVEMGGPLHSPHIAGVNTGGSGSSLSPGAYSYRAVYQWTDAAGLLHRSRPSAPVTLTMSGTASPILRVTKPDTMRNGVSQAAVEVLIYATPLNQADYHLMPSSPTSSDAFQYTYNSVAAVTAGYPQLYSGGANGEEVVPTPPPPLHDIAIVQSRAWGIDAELRSRLVYSKYRVAGTGFEWSPAYEIAFPSGSGKLMAVREWSGQVVVLAERAVFTISGDGPSNQIGDPGTFAPPVKISDFGCSNADSVVVTPAGVFWQDGDRIILMTAAGGVNPVPEIRATDQVSGTLLLRNQREVCFFSGATAEIKVVSYDAPLRWSKWDAQTLAVSAQNVALLPYDPNAALVYNAGTGAIYRLDAASISAAPSMQWTTDWIVLDGDFQSSIIVEWVVFNGYTAGPHGIVLDIYEDYEISPSTTRTWSAAALAAMTDGGGRYTIRMEPSKQRARAVRLRIRDDITGQAGSAGVEPRSVTVVFSVDGALHEVAFLQGATQ